jgi:hypothetical protein
MVFNLQRLTTEYIESEDRIRITGEVENGPPVVIWMTHRLFSRLVPAILQWLEKQTASTSSVAASRSGESELLQSFAQEAAVAALKPQPSVSANTNAVSWVVQSLDLQGSNTHLRITFLSQPDHSAFVMLTPTQIRQWLSIVYFAWMRAQWAPQLWPDWIKGDGVEKKQIVLH